MKTVAYLLTSFDREEIRKQKQTILEFAVGEQLTISRFIEIPISSPLPTKGRKLNRLLSHVESGDILIVSRLSQIGWSLSEIVKTVDMLIKKEVRFVAVEEGIDLNGKPSTQSQVIAAMFGMLAEIGHRLVSRHTKEALAVAKRKGPHRRTSTCAKSAATRLGYEILPTSRTLRKRDLRDAGYLQNDTLQLHQKGKCHTSTG